MQHTQYKIGVITNSTGHSIKSLSTVAEANGVVFETIPFTHISLNDLASSKLVKKILSYDVVYYRTGMRDTALREIAQILRKANVPLVNAGHTSHPLHKKIHQAIIAGQYQIPQPKSLVLASGNYNTVKEQLGVPFVAKPDLGSKGNKVNLIHSEAEFIAYINNKGKNDYLFQEYIQNTEEYRVYIIDRQGVATYKKQVGSDDFRANLHLGGTIQITEPHLSTSLLNFGTKVAEAFNADIAGIDILVKNGQYLFLELNWQPGWAQLEEKSGINFAEATIQFLLNRAAKKYLS